MSAIQIIEFQPDFQQPAAELINSGLGDRFRSRDDSMNPDLHDIAAYYADHCFLVALLNRQVIGTGALLRESPLEVQVVRMHTAKRCRRQGVASSVLRELEQRAIEYGAEEAFLETNLDWHDAHAFYRSAGYHEFQHDVSAIWFCKRLGISGVA